MALLSLKRLGRTGARGHSGELEGFPERSVKTRTIPTQLSTLIPRGVYKDRSGGRVPTDVNNPGLTVNLINPKGLTFSVFG